MCPNLPLISRTTSRKALLKLIKKSLWMRMRLCLCANVLDKTEKMMTV